MISVIDYINDTTNNQVNSEFITKHFLDDAFEDEILDFEEIINSIGSNQQSNDVQTANISNPDQDSIEIFKSQVMSKDIGSQINRDASIQQPFSPMDTTQIELDQFFGMLDVMSSTFCHELPLPQPKLPVSQPVKCTSPQLSSLSTNAPPSPTDHLQIHGKRHSTTKPSTGTNIPTPRHLRESHIRAERKRQSKIKGAKEQLKELLSLPRASESKIVDKAVERCQSLKAELVRLDKESSRLKTEKEALIADIDIFQQNLPASGVVPVASGSSMTELYEKHFTVGYQNNPKFGVFEQFMQPLFQSYVQHVENISSTEELKNSVQCWCKQNLTLSYLRPVISNGLLHLVRNSNLLMHGPVIKASTKRQS